MYLQTVKWENKDSQSQIKNIQACAVGTEKYLLIFVNDQDILNIFSGLKLEFSMPEDPKEQTFCKFTANPLNVLEVLVEAGIIEKKYANHISDQFPDGLGGHTHLDPNRAPQRKPQFFTCSGAVRPVAPRLESKSLFSSNEEDEGSERPTKRRQINRN